LIGKISLSFDAKKIVFDFRQDPESAFRIWEVLTDGTGLRQISVPAPDERKRGLAQGNRGTPMTSTPAICRTARSSSPRPVVSISFLCSASANLAAPCLHRMNADGTRVEQLTKSPVSGIVPGGPR